MTSSASDASIDAMIKLVNTFDFERIEKTMIALDWKWGMKEKLRTPTIDEMRDKCLNMLICAERNIDTVSSGGFEASCNFIFDEDPEDPKRKVFTLKFVVADIYITV